ncbi:MAG: DUF4238 domain-containing protein [Mobilitalea sp.]
MSGDAKYHHLIPRTYMKPWCFKNKSIYVYDKKTGCINTHNIDNFCGVDYYHSIKAGSLYTSPQALEYLYGFLKDYKIEYNGQLIETLQEKNQSFNNFNQWIIRYPNNKIVNKKDRNVLNQRIKQNIYNEIEQQWNQQYENNWKTIIDTVSDKLVRIKSGENLFLTSDDADTLMRYIIMFDWRGLM